MKNFLIRATYDNENEIRTWFNKNYPNNRFDDYWFDSYYGVINNKCECYFADDREYPATTIIINSISEIEPDTNTTISWLKNRIKKTEKELESATKLNLKIDKGAKLYAYKECLNYINSH
jgi:hypothetical protein